MQSSRKRGVQGCVLGLPFTLAVFLTAISGCSIFTAGLQEPSPQPSSLTSIPTIAATTALPPTITGVTAPTGTELPGPTPQATKTAPSCPDMMDAVLQLEPPVSDSPTPEIVPAGDSVKAGWRIKNTGGCIWDSAYVVQFVDPGDPGWETDSSSTRLARPVRPGETMDVWVEAIVPPISGTQSVSWELLNGRGERIGNQLTLTIDAAALPTGDTRPERWFSVVPESIQPGERVTLSWSMAEAKAVYLDGPGISGPPSPLETAASRYVFPPHTSKYKLQVINGDDSVDQYSVTVEVEDYLEPRIKTFSITQSEPSPNCVMVAWTTANRVNRVIVYRNDQVIWDGTIDDGVIRDCPPIGRSVYILEVYGPGGMDTGTRSYVRN